jgi:3,4-dehydroadipyl-CoA semialdehyde dehydrogenase
LYDTAAAAIAARLAKTTVGNPRNEAVRMGALVSRAQLKRARRPGPTAADANCCTTAATHTLVDADPAVACCIGPTLLGTRDPDGADVVHDVEVFGPVATLMPYRDAARAGAGAPWARARWWRRCTAPTLPHWPPPRWSWPTATAACTSSPDVAALHTGHGNVMPQSLHGGPGRAGGGEELGGLRALGFYHRRSAVQASTAVLAALGS